MSNPSDDIAMKVLSEINSRTLVNGAGIDPGLISSALDISSSELATILGRLKHQGLVRLDTNNLAGLTPAGHEHMTAH